MNTVDFKISYVDKHVIVVYAEGIKVFNDCATALDFITAKLTAASKD